MFSDDKMADVLQRLKRISGQVQGLTRMLEEGRYCIDVIHQVSAVEAALHKVAELILRNHLETCVAASFESRDEADRAAKVDELIRVFAGMRAR